MDLGSALAGSWGTTLRQPDARTCGPSALTVARMLNRPVAARGLLTTPFHEQVLAVHRATNTWYDVAGRLQVPWPRALGTAPWALARLMSAADGAGVPGARYHPDWVRTGHGGFTALADAVRAGHAVPFYVGSRWLPRHIALAIGVDDDALTVYDPATGRPRAITRGQWESSRLRLSGWDQPWWVVTPEPPADPPG